MSAWPKTSEIPIRSVSKAGLSAAAARSSSLLKRVSKVRLPIAIRNCGPFAPIDLGCRESGLDGDKLVRTGPTAAGQSDQSTKGRQRQGPSLFYTPKKSVPRRLSACGHTPTQRRTPVPAPAEVAAAGYYQ